MRASSEECSVELPLVRSRLAPPGHLSAVQRVRSSEPGWASGWEPSVGRSPDSPTAIHPTVANSRLRETSQGGTIMRELALSEIGYVCGAGDETDARDTADRSEERRGGSEGG